MLLFYLCALKKKWCPIIKVEQTFMANLKGLAKETAIYGLSSIVGRFLNYLLVPVYTIAMSAQSGGYGVVTNIYAWVALVLVLLTFGMETGFFRFAGKGEDDPMRVYSTALTGVGGVSLAFLVVGLACLEPIAGWLGYEEHPEYVGMMMAVVAMDAIQSIPFAYLRYSYAFLFNLICTGTIMLCLIPELRGLRYGFDPALMRRMTAYSLPLLVLGIAGILNQVADKIIFPYVYPDAGGASVQLGIYGAASKIAMIMAMLTQAFRYAYEPFVFGKSRDKDNRETYAAAMKYFVIFTLLAYLAVMFYLDLLKYLIGRDYWEGLRVVPIVMAAEICMGIYFNLSFWYKLIDQTRWGAYFSLTGCAVLVVLNVLFIPRYGYMACAWAGLAGYGVAMLLSYFVGQRKYPIRYDLRGIGLYLALAAVLYALAVWVPIENLWLRLGFRTVLLFLFIIYIVKKDLPLSSIPLLNRLVKK